MELNKTINKVYFLLCKVSCIKNERDRRRALRLGEPVGNVVAQALIAAAGRPDLVQAINEWVQEAFVGRRPDPLRSIIAIDEATLLCRQFADYLDLAEWVQVRACYDHMKRISAYIQGRIKKGQGATLGTDAAANALRQADEVHLNAMNEIAAKIEEGERGGCLGRVQSDQFTRELYKFYERAFFGKL